ncbi:MAG: phosphoribosylamine--glycine ligase [Thermaerobacter sp.]|nr:phosphoribosylamine--glycine ligase [Thermaerobacter sp.]
MNVVVVGSGFREHALARACQASPMVDRVVVAPGNAGMVEDVECVAAADATAVSALAKDLNALVLIGPEAPLAAGWADHLRHEGLLVCGPSAAAAELESSKVDAKSLMERVDVPTARAQVVASAAEADRVLSTWQGPVVVKADGLAAGKGVLVTDGPLAARDAVRQLMGDRRFGTAAHRVLLEERLLGPELSAMALTDGRRLAWLPATQDYKRVGDGDIGPNTGGMGAVGPHAQWTPQLADWLAERVFMPVVDELTRQGRPFAGVLYAGLMMTADGPRVLEWNVRLGDPEAAVALALVTDDLMPYWLGVATGELPSRPPAWSGAAVAVVMAASGYPDRSEPGAPVAYAAEPGVVMLHAGTRRDAEGQLVSGGGRTLLAVGSAGDVPTARQRAYSQVAQVQFPGMVVRSDIAAEYCHS